MLLELDSSLYSNIGEFKPSCVVFNFSVNQFILYVSFMHKIDHVHVVIPSVLERKYPHYVKDVLERFTNKDVDVIRLDCDGNVSDHGLCPMVKVYERILSNGCKPICLNVAGFCKDYKIPTEYLDRIYYVTVHKSRLINVRKHVLTVLPEDVIKPIALLNFENPCHRCKLSPIKIITPLSDRV